MVSLLNDIVRRKIFQEEGFYIFKSFVERDQAVFIRNEVLENKHCFIKSSNKGNHRLFHYPNSPYIYPKWLEELYKSIMLFKIECCTHEKFHFDYCQKAGIGTNDLDLIFNTIKLHTWSCFYLYQEREMHAKHIDNYGEIAAFLILSELGSDYDQGGLYIYGESDENNVIYLDELYEIGDLIIFDQARLWHEVKPIKTLDDQIGRLQYYLPSIPYRYMNDILFFEDYEKEPYFAIRESPLNKAAMLSNIDNDKYKKIHYSRKNYFRNWKNHSLL